MSANTHRAAYIIKNGVTVRLAELSYVFTCPAPDCEYVMTARTQEAIDIVEDTHYKIAPSTHLEFLKEKNAEAFEAKVAEADAYVVESLEHARYAHSKGWRS